MAAASPLLEVLIGQGSATAGAIFPVQGPEFVIGRSGDAHLRITGADLLDRRHCRLELSEGQWLITDLESSHGTLHNGRRIVRAPLRHGDLVELPGPITFRFLTEPPRTVRSEAMEAEILKAPDSEERWLVYADWLMEQGAPFDAPVAKGGQDLRVLGPFAGHVERNEVSVEWYFGLPQRLVLRGGPVELRHMPTGQAEMLGWLARPEFRFLRSLTVERTPSEEYGVRLMPPVDAREIVGWLEAIPALPLLESLLLKPGAATPPGSQIPDAFEAMKRRHPRLRTTFQTLFSLY